MEALLKELESHLKATVQKLKQDLQGIRSGRPSTQLLENVQVNYFEQLMPIKQLGSLSIKPPREIDITVWDQGAIAAVAKAIQDAKIGLTPNVEGNIIRCFLPPLTEERRDELSRIVKKMAEEARIKIRTIRDEVNKKIKSAEADEDQAFKAKEKIQKVVDEANKEIESSVAAKLEEIKE